MTQPEQIGPGRWWVWQCDAGDTLPEETASKAYQKKFGRPPEYIVKQIETGYLWLGPEPEPAS